MVKTRISTKEPSKNGENGTRKTTNNGFKNGKAKNGMHKNGKNTSAPTKLI